MMSREGWGCAGYIVALVSGRMRLGWCWVGFGWVALARASWLGSGWFGWFGWDGSTCPGGMHHEITHRLTELAISGLGFGVGVWGSEREGEGEQANYSVVSGTQSNVYRSSGFGQNGKTKGLRETGGEFKRTWKLDMGDERNAVLQRLAEGVADGLPARVWSTTLPRLCEMGVWGPEPERREVGLRKGRWWVTR